MPRMSNHKSHLQENQSKNQQDSIVGLPIEGNMAGDNYYNLDQNNETFNMGQFEQAFCMDELFMEGVQTVTPASSFQNDIAEEVFEFPNMDVVVHDFSGLIEELGMDYNTSFESVFLDQDHQVQVPSTEEWSFEVRKARSAEEEIEGQGKKNIDSNACLVSQFESWS
ncbi:UNVERIFIED_CONTAM: hypothetical protein Sradi_1560700 [Sesamum radiatum]|uniref:Uncharacterized protein n=1 Tax=Sesamum radiatum TaxID=300843 RepID=A0AAW2U8M8_SESRA